MVNGEQQLPDGWKMAKISDIGADEKYAIVDGPFGSMLKVSDYIEGGTIPVISISNIDVGFASDQLRYISEEKFKQIKRSAVKGGDILVAKIGSSYGKAGYYPNWMPVGIIPANLLKITVSEKINKPYVYYYLKSSGFKKLLDGITKSTAQPAFNVSAFRELPIPLPALPEQERIVAKIEELFTQLEAGISALVHVRVGLKRYKASVLKAAVEGKLLETRELENSSELREGWKWTTIGELAKVGTGSTPLRSKEKYWKNGTIPWITSGALNDLQVFQANEFVTEIALKETNVKIFPAGTLLVAMYGEGKTRGKVSELMIDATTNQACAALVFDKKQEEYKPFIKIFFQKYYEDIRLLSSGGVQPNLNLSIIKNTRLPLPPLEEQRRIVAEVERRLSVAREVESVVEKALVRAVRLRQSVLRSAFEGRL